MITIQAKAKAFGQTHTMHSNVRLIHPDHPYYNKWVNRIRDKKRKTPHTDPRAAAYYHALTQWETIIQHLLNTILIPNCPERILAYQTPNTHGQYRQQYRELDHVTGTKTNPQLIIEIKLSEHPPNQTRSPNTAWTQLNKALQITHHKWPHLQAHSININMEQIIHPHTSLTPHSYTPITHLHHTITQNKQPTIWITGTEIATYATTHNLLTLQDIQNLPNLRTEMLTTTWENPPTPPTPWITF